MNHTPVTSVNALRAILQALQPGPAAVMQIERNGKLMYLVAEFE